MGKRKIFVRTDLTTPGVEHVRDAAGQVVIPLVAIPPKSTSIQFPPNAKNARSFDFGPWYGLGIDPITYACQRQIERFLDKQDSDVEVTTIVSYCRDGLLHLFRYLIMVAAAHGRSLTLTDINRHTVDGYLLYLRDKGSYESGSQRTTYSFTKSVLHALGRRGIITLTSRGDDSTFPINPFPNLRRDGRGEKPLSSSERKEFTIAVKTAVLPLFHSDDEPSWTLLGYALLVVALHTGRNTTPLLEMQTDCLRPHPKDDTEFLVLYKRRGHTSSKIALRESSNIERIVEATPTLRPTVAQLIRRVIYVTRGVREDAPDSIKGLTWLYRSERATRSGGVKGLDDQTLSRAISSLIQKYHLTDHQGNPLRVNVSRLRKTFINRINEILDGDVVSTALAAGNSVTTVKRHYLRATKEARSNWQFMGTALVKELLTKTIGATERTPVGRCSDTKAGEYAPKREGSVCQSFLNCLRCSNYVVTGDDLWRLYSFYWRVLRERPRVDKQRWERQLAHIPRLIERDVVEAGLSRKVFTPVQVNAARDRARNHPHPFWASGTIINEVSSLT